MSPLIDDEIVKAAWHAFCTADPDGGTRAALLAALPMIGERLAKDIETKHYLSGVSWESDTGVGISKLNAVRIRELTGAKP